MRTTFAGVCGALAAVLAVGGPSVQAIPGAGLARRATVCNGSPELCSRSYGTLTYVATHNSYAVGINNLSFNQDHNTTQQLNDGVRMLQMQAHIENGAIRLCHSDCFLQDGGTLEAYLATVKAWLDANPNEVLSLLIVNSDNATPQQFAESFVRNGLDAISYKPPTPVVPAAEWPTLGELIDSNQRLITFLSKGAKMAEVPYLIDEFTNVWESAFNVIDPTKFTCEVDRTNGDPTTQLYAINHFLDRLVLGQPVPDIDNLNRTNSASGFGSLGAHVDTCLALHQRPPNFLLVDFYEYGGGSVFEVAAKLNGVAYSPTRPIATPVATAVGTQTNAPSQDDGSGFSLVPPISGSVLAFAATTFLASVVVAPMLVF